MGGPERGPKFMETDLATVITAALAAGGLRLARGAAEWMVLAGKACLVRAVGQLPPGAGVAERGWIAGHGAGGRR